MEQNPNIILSIPQFNKIEIFSIAFLGISICIDFNNSWITIRTFIRRGYSFFTAFIMYFLDYFARINTLLVFRTLSSEIIGLIKKCILKLKVEMAKIYLYRNQLIISHNRNFVCWNIANLRNIDFPKSEIPLSICTFSW